MSFSPFPLPKFLPLNLASSISRQTSVLNTRISMLGLNPAKFSSSYSYEEVPWNEELLKTATSYSSRKEYPKDFSFIRVIQKEGSELDVIPFQFMPRAISDNKAAMYNDIHIIGRSSPFKSYSGSSARSINFMLEFYAAPEQGSSDPTPQKIKQLIDRLQALVYPIYIANRVNPPPLCLVHIGDQINMLGVCKGVNTNYDNSKTPWTGSIRGGHYAFGAAVQLSFEEIQDVPLGYYERKQGKDWLGNMAAYPEDTQNSRVASEGTVVPPGVSPTPNQEAFIPPARSYTAVIVGK